jgi:hypothetical protein
MPEGRWPERVGESRLCLARRRASWCMRELAPGGFGARPAEPVQACVLLGRRRSVKTNLLDARRLARLGGGDAAGVVDLRRRRSNSYATGRDCARRSPLVAAAGRRACTPRARGIERRHCTPTTSRQPGRRPGSPNPGARSRSRWFVPVPPGGERPNIVRLPRYLQQRGPATESAGDLRAASQRDSTSGFKFRVGTGTVAHRGAHSTR